MSQVHKDHLICTAFGDVWYLEKSPVDLGIVGLLRWKTENKGIVDRAAIGISSRLAKNPSSNETITLRLRVCNGRCSPKHKRRTCDGTEEYGIVIHAVRERLESYP